MTFLPIKHSLFLLLSLTLVACVNQQEQETAKEDPKIKLIVDADTANEIDDLYAIVSAIREPKFDLLGITSAQFHTSPLASDTTVLESQYLNEQLLHLLGEKEIPLPLGSNQPITSMTQPAISEASSFIIEQAQQLDAQDTLHLVILGSCTNVASAILQEPSIIPKLSVHYIGFWHDPKVNSYDKKEFNSGNDTLAVEVLLNNPALDFNVMSATTCQHLVFEKTTVDEQLKGKSAVGDYLVNRWETYERWWTKEDPEKKRWIMWDVAIIEALANPSLAKKTYFKTPPENTAREIEIYTTIDVPAMEAQFWGKLMGEL